MASRWSECGSPRRRGPWTRSFSTVHILSCFSGVLEVTYLSDMRVRILKHGEGVVDGVSLRSLVPGGIYDVNPALGHYLVTNEFAEELASDSDPALVGTADTPYA